MPLTDDKKKVLLILRHAKSSLKYGDIPDHERPLNKRGKKQGPEMGILLKELHIVPEYIISSTAKRAVDTARTVAEFCGYDGEINHDPLLYQASAEQYVKVLSVVPDNYHRVLIVGHNPAVEDLVEKLTNMIEMMKTCSLAQIDVKVKSWRDLVSDRNNNTLVNVWHPAAKDE